MKCLRCIFIISLVIALSELVRCEQIDWETLQTDKVENPPQAVKLEYKFKVNDQRRYEMTVAGEGQLKLPGQVEGAALQSNSKLLFTQRVISVDQEKATWKLQWDLVKGTMEMPDFKRVGVSLPSLQVDIDKYGAVKQIAGLEKLAGSSGLSGGKTAADIIIQLKFPGFLQKDLKPGDTWQQQYTVHLPEQKPVIIKVNSSFTGFSRIAKLDCAVVRTTYEVPYAFSTGIDDPSAKFLVGKEKGEFQTHFAYKEGRIVQCFGTISIEADAKPQEPAPEPKEEAKPPLEPPGDAPPGSTVTVAPKPEPPEPEKCDLKVKYHVVSRWVGDVQPQTAGGEKE